MQTVDIHQAMARLSHLVDQAAKGRPFIIAKAGKPMVKVVPLDAPSQQPVRRLGFLAGHIAAPDDFDNMGGRKIQRLFDAEG
jgi:prevent-host-death family protein